MSRSRSPFRQLLVITLAASALACGSELGAPTNDVAVQEQPIFAPSVWNMACPIPPSVDGFIAPLGAPGGGLAFAPVESLTVVPNPVIPVVGGVRTIRADLAPYILDLPSAIQLGKALFWDIQAGSDNNTACASCHFQAGADNRIKNQLHPGPNNVFDKASLDYTLSSLGTDYPFNDPANPDPTLHPISNDNATGSQGVRQRNFVSVVGAVENVAVPTAGVDPVFGTGTRRTTGVNTPPTVNAVFNHRNFHNGRSQPDFNGVNPFGKRDAAAKVWQVNLTTKAVAQVAISIQNASLASQAVGPPLNDTEMSAAGRTFPELGKKMLASKALGLQTVSKTDSVLGAIVATKGKGLSRTYTQLIQKAFQPAWWNSAATVTDPVSGKPYTLMQANFSLYWGLSIMLYEATLVADQSPMDRYLASRVIGLDNFLPTFGYVTSHNTSLLKPTVDRLLAQGTKIHDRVDPALPTHTASAAELYDLILVGLDLFERTPPPWNPPASTGTKNVPQVGSAVHPAERFCAAGSTSCPNNPAGPNPPPKIPQPGGVGCGFCHVGAELTSASVRNLTMGLEPGGIPAGFDGRMERMFMGVRPQEAGAPPPPVPFGTDKIVYDTTNGQYNLTVTGIRNATVPAQNMDVRVYDVGWYNVGVRPEPALAATLGVSPGDPGIGGQDPFGNGLAWSDYLKAFIPADPTNLQGRILVPGGGLECIDAAGRPISPPAAPVGSFYAGEVIDPSMGFPVLFGPLQKNEKSDSVGSMKTSHLRNLELTGPYFHNGGKATLRQAIELYDDGGNFENPNRPPLIHPLGLSPYEIDALVAFLLALTDDRVRLEQAPFDHPELPLPAGNTTPGCVGTACVDVITLLPPVGAAGTATALKPFLNLNPFQ